MKHVRQDYNRIQDPDGIIPEDEPVMLFRAQDQLAHLALRFYAGLCRRRGLHDVAELADQQADAMLRWPKKKLPDL
jgi:hypothetical protein